jgi:hypothetical protein
MEVPRIDAHGRVMGSGSTYGKGRIHGVEKTKLLTVSRAAERKILPEHVLTRIVLYERAEFPGALRLLFKSNMTRRDLEIKPSGSEHSPRSSCRAVNSAPHP